MSKNKTSVVNFLTGGQYVGKFNHSIEEMDGFGMYTFPHGRCEYRGYFKRGLFHGYGCLTISTRSKVVCKGYFNEGILVSIYEIIFGDGLRVDCALEKGSFKKQNWKYCFGDDRRYSTEIQQGVQPVGPESFLTCKQPPVELQPQKYDVGEGIFSLSGFLSYDIVNQFNYKMRFINCEKEKNWIRKHCRRGPNLSLPEKIATDFEREILLNNLKSSEVFESCPCNELIERQRVLCIKCKQNLTTNTDESSSVGVGAPLSVSSTISHSFDDVSVTEDINSFPQNLWTAVKRDKNSKFNSNQIITTKAEDLSLFNPARLSELSRVRKTFSPKAYKFKSHVEPTNT